MYIQPLSALISIAMNIIEVLMNMFNTPMNIIIMFMNYSYYSHFHFSTMKWNLDFEVVPKCALRIYTAATAVTQFLFPHPRTHLFPCMVTIIVRVSFKMSIENM